MYRNIICFIIIILTTICLFKIFNTGYIEHLTNDEAVKNLASLYNNSQLTVTNLTTTGNATINKLTLGNSGDLQTTLTNLQNSINDLQNQQNQIKNDYVKKGPINLVASYSNAYGNARTNNPVGISDNYFLRSWPIAGQDVAANSLAAKFSIL